jgi:hypothetical protein
MSDPFAALRECHRIMKPSAILVVNTPNIGSIWARLFGQNWWFLLSHHLYYFTPRSMDAMLRKCGFRVIAVRRHYQWLELGHLIKMVGLYGKPVSRSMQAAARLLRIDSLQVPYYASQMNVVARKMEGDLS